MWKRGSVREWRRQQIQMNAFYTLEFSILTMNILFKEKAKCQLPYENECVHEARLLLPWFLFSLSLFLYFVAFESNLSSFWLRWLLVLLLPLILHLLFYVIIPLLLLLFCSKSFIRRRHVAAEDVLRKNDDWNREMCVLFVFLCGTCQWVCVCVWAVCVALAHIGFGRIY